MEYEPLSLAPQTSMTIFQWHLAISHGIDGLAFKFKLLKEKKGEKCILCSSFFPDVNLPPVSTCFIDFLVPLDDCFLQFVQNLLFPAGESVQ